MQWYEKRGWFVMRSAGSHGMADLIAINPNTKIIHLIQCKITKRGTIFPGERKVYEDWFIKINGNYSVVGVFNISKSQKHGNRTR